MKNLLKLCLLSAVLLLPNFAYAQTDAAPKSTTSMNCPMAGNMSGMRQNMGAMMTDMGTMMKNTTDPSMKARMQKMHDQMGTMMTQMQQMGGGMMGGNMMQGGQNAPAKPPATPDNHASHHSGP